MICDDPEVLELDTLSTASDRLEEAWRKYESSQLDVLSLLAEYVVGDEQITFTEMKEFYEAVKEEAAPTVKGEVKEEVLEEATKVKVEV